MKAESLADFKQGIKNSANSLPGTLSCDKHGGPNDDFAQKEMVYWSTIPSDSLYQSHYLSNLQRYNKETKNQVRAKRMYLSFEFDGGGWNNIRMSMETSLSLAVAMGRTLVLPPKKRMYLLGHNQGHNRTNQQYKFSFTDFFPMEKIANDNAALDMISMEEFLETEAMTGNLIDIKTGKPSFPPNNKTAWDGEDYDELRFWLRTVTHVPLDYNPQDCLATFPISGDLSRAENLNQNLKAINDGTFMVDSHQLVKVSDPVIYRMKDNLAGRQKLCFYDKAMQSAPVVHFICDHKRKIRMLNHFYSFLLFENWIEDLWTKRFIRDQVRYNDYIQCAAARIIQQLREIARKRDPMNNPTGEFHSFHIRRGDFQFKKNRISIEEIFGNSKDELRTPANATIFISTDERDKSFFNLLKQYYDVHFLDEFVHEHLKDVNTNYYGMIEQLVASRGKIFFGCYMSSFTGYIMRIRGYHSVLKKEPGYDLGILPSTYYYSQKERKFEMHKYAPMRPGFSHREFPTSWRDIDRGIGITPL